MIFVDHSYLLTLINRADPNCEEAHELLGFRGPREIWITTHLQIGTFCDELAAHLTPTERARVLATIAATHQLKVLPISAAQQAEANGMLASVFDPPASYADATSLLVARGLGVSQTLSFSDSLERYGLERVRS